MTDLQEAKLSMFLAVKDFLAGNAPVVTALPQFNTFLTSFTTAVDQIQAIRTTQENDRTGIAANKKQLRADMTTQAVDIARKLTALAQVTNNATLLAEVKYTQSDFTRAADTIARDRALLIQQKSVLNLLALAPYGVTAALNTSLLTSINAFNAAIPSPRTGITTKKQSTTKLKEYFATADKVLNTKMSPLIETLRISNLDFYNGFITSRRINDDHASRKLSLRANVSDAVTGLPLANVIVKVAETNDTKKTTTKGSFQLKLLNTGTYNFTFTKAGYKDNKQVVYINEGETTELNVKMEGV